MKIDHSFNFLIIQKCNLSLSPAGCLSAAIDWCIGSYIGIAVGCGTLTSRATGWGNLAKSCADGPGAFRVVSFSIWVNWRCDTWCPTSKEFTALWVREAETDVTLLLGTYFTLPQVHSSRFKYNVTRTLSHCAYVFGILGFVAISQAFDVVIGHALTNIRLGCLMTFEKTNNW